MKKNWVIITATTFLLFAAAGCLFTGSGDRFHAKARKEWKENAIPEISRRILDQAWLTYEIGALKRVKTNEQADSENWLSDNLILMMNGEWIVYASVCSKEDARIHDIFIGRGSDGKWYYSTYHFCVRMLSLKAEDQPESLLEFNRTYYLREFDGHSNKCLSKTWPLEH